MTRKGGGLHLDIAVIKKKGQRMQGKPLAECPRARLLCIPIRPGLASQGQEFYLPISQKYLKHRHLSQIEASRRQGLCLLPWGSHQKAREHEHPLNPVFISYNFNLIGPL